MSAAGRWTRVSLGARAALAALLAVGAAVLAVGLGLFGRALVEHHAAQRTPAPRRDCS